MANNPLAFYTWQGYRCAYTVHGQEGGADKAPALLLVHPIGVGLSGIFWHRFIDAWLKQGRSHLIYNLDLLGCGASEMPHLAYHPSDWAAQLKYAIETVMQKPLILVVQGALFPVALQLLQNPPQENWIRGLVLSGPPAWRTMSEGGNPWQKKLLWNLFFDSPIGLGKAFFRYARRRQFLRDFSVRQLFARAEDVDDEWLDFLEKGARDLNSRHAVFSFLAGFWREDYSRAIAAIQQPTLVVFGEEASSISREGISETPEQRLQCYLKSLPKARGCKIPGRNVLPYESTAKFVEVVGDFVEFMEK